MALGLETSSKVMPAPVSDPPILPTKLQLVIVIFVLTSKKEITPAAPDRYENDDSDMVIGFEV